jgi:putative heme-binding domain-containing protein
VREAAARHLAPLKAITADGATLPPIPDLARQRGDIERGRRTFAAVCSSCHQAEGVGTHFGPDLSLIGAKLSRAALHAAILDPDAGVSFNYRGSQLSLGDGTEVVGIVTSETEHELLLRVMGEITQRYAVSEVVNRTTVEGFLMPAGLQRALTLQGLVDLVEYLGSLGR